MSQTGTRSLTRIGTVGSTAAPAVDECGAVSPGGVDGNWSLEWWIGADDRWHVPAEETAVRQGLVGYAPVVETKVRVPGGDAIHRTYGARSAAGRDVPAQEFVVVEVENASPVPFALALVARPSDHGSIRHITTEALSHSTAREASQLVRVDGKVAILLPRPAPHVACGSGYGEVRAAVTSGRAVPWHPAAIAAVEGHAEFAAIYPVTHRTTFRALLPVGEQHGVLEWPPALPTVDQVAKGWTAQVERGAEFDLPDPKLMGTVERMRRQVLLRAEEPECIPALDLFGFHHEAKNSLLNFAMESGARFRPTRTFGPGDYINALHQHWELTRDRGVLSASAETLGEAVSEQARIAPSNSVLLARLLFEQLGLEKARADVDRILRRSPPDERALEALPPLVALLETERPAAFARTLVANLASWSVQDRNLVLLPTEPSASWHGQPLQVSKLPTPSGRLAFAVRWHGERPALLWELEPHADVGGTTLRAPNLDRSWSTADLKGEALLARVPPPRAEVDGESFT